MRQAKQDGCVWLSDLRPVRDYCYIQDLVEAIALACAVNGEECVFNIGSGEGTSVEEMAKFILRLGETDIPIRQKPHSERPQDTDIQVLIADAGKAKAVLGWEPRTLLADGLMETIAWMKRSGDI
jgi:nucleoside-diphosphate-sugar epimerase